MTDDTFPWMLTFASAKNWLDTIRSERTKEIYVLRLKQYCDAVGKNPDELIELKVDGLRNVATAKEFQAESLLNNYLYNNNLTSNIQTAVLFSVKSFYKANWRELNSNVGSNIESPEPKKRTPKMQDILELEEAMTYLRDKAILWFLESAPFRKATLTKLQWKDLKSTETLLKQVREEAKGQVSRTPEEDKEIAEKVPYYLVIESARLKGGGKGRYKGVKQIGFIHAFAAKKLEMYKQELKERNLPLNDDSYLFVTYSHNWVVGKGSKMEIVNFDDASLIAWHDLDKKRFSPQDMRDMLQGALENARVSPNIAAPLLGHKVKGVDKHYSNHEIDEFLQAYLDALPWMVPQTVEQVKAETQKKLEEDKKEITKLEYDNIDLKGKMNSLNNRQETTEKELAFIKKYVFTNASVIETKEDLGRLQEFLEKYRKEKEETNILPVDEDIDETSATKPDFEKNAHDELERQRKARQK